ncbi:MAG: accessory factor UbiK family protein [Alphaproteobacteria bacterium]
MQTQNRLFDDLARVAGGAFGALAGLRNEIEEMVKQRLERLLADLDHVPREEFDAVRAMAEKARTEQEALMTRVAALEAALAEAQKPRAKAKPKPASKDSEADGGDS